MKITIEESGLKTLLHTMLSCRCPVNEETERALFRAYAGIKGQEMIDFNAILDVADANPVPTPVHFLRDFCVYLQDDPAEFTITHDDVLRYFCTSYHLNRMKHLDPVTVRYPAAFLVSHLLVPALVTESDGTSVATFSFNGHNIRFRNIVVSPEWALREGAYYGLHMGVVVSPLTEEQVQMVNGHLKLSETFCFLAEHVTDADFAAFEHYGDYRANVLTRYQRHSEL